MAHTEFELWTVKFPNAEMKKKTVKKIKAYMNLQEDIDSIPEALWKLADDAVASITQSANKK
jgi:hypothetical protein